MTRMGAAAFKAQCLQVMEKVRQTRRPVTITKRGVPVVRVVPADPPEKFALGALAGQLTSRGDIVSSPLSDQEWKRVEQERNAQADEWMKEGQRARKHAARGLRRR